MTLELNRATFRRLVQFNILLLLTLPFSVAAEFLVPSYVAFSADYDALVATHFGESNPPEALLWIVAAALTGLIVWWLASTVGLLWFKRWARLGFWAAPIVILVLFIPFLGFQPTYSLWFEDLLGLLESVTAGAILLMAYARGLGAEWFAPPSDQFGE